MAVSRVALVGDFNTVGNRRTASCSNAIRRLLKASKDVQLQLFEQRGIVFLPNLPCLAQKKELTESLGEYEPHISVCMVGLTNDSNMMEKLNGCVEYLRISYRKLIEDDCLRGPGFTAIIVGPPCRSTARACLDTVCRELSLELGCRYIDTHKLLAHEHYSDASHLNSKGAKKLAEVIAAAIQRGAADLERLRAEHTASSPKRRRASTVDTDMEMQKRLEQLGTDSSMKQFDGVTGSLAKHQKEHQAEPRAQTQNCHAKTD
eukprot:TRINITY_DN12356_c0_g1_i2.p1 TRINITY_DN12356_c0_g1~~TRINITY_DN12356_c0_g1_i2.p1  ORF type:complete len:284 (+),score=43.74 TRINITY_DN12356_c0_g1_i2:72-854(+)